MYVFPEEMKRCYESSPISFVYYQNIDGKAVPVLVSDGFCEKVGMKRTERSRVLTWLQTGLFARIHQDDVGYMSKISEDFLHHRAPYDAAFRCRLEDEYVWVHGIGKWQTMPDGTELAVIAYANMTEFREQIVSALQEYDLLIRDKFYTDSLTGLPNTNYLHEYGRERVNVLMSEGKTPSVIYADVYSMVSYNNHYGFREGDELLRLVASEMKEHFPGELVMRGANDHFILITGVQNNEEIASRLVQINEGIKKKARGNTLGLRSGICRMAGGTDLLDAMDRARKVMRTINDDMNRAYAFSSQELDDRYWKNRYIIENFLRALEKNWIKIFYQGIMRMETGKVAAFEALARWVDPVRGTISPADFIPVLQRYHQLYKLDLYMMEQVCREVFERKENNLPLVPVSVNFSRQDFDHADIAEAIEELYVKYGMEKYVPRDYFIVEITEQDIAKGSESFRKQLQEIRRKGYRVWLDDFGSGYSGLNVFSKYDFDLIKFDMELLRHLNDKGGVNRLILKEMVCMARELGIHTLAEGLETEEQLTFIQEIGCELAQGFRFYRPEPLDEILYRLANGQKIRVCEPREERMECDQRLRKNRN